MRSDVGTQSVCVWPFVTVDFSEIPSQLPLPEAGDELELHASGASGTSRSMVVAERTSRRVGFEVMREAYPFFPRCAAVSLQETAAIPATSWWAQRESNPEILPASGDSSGASLVEAPSPVETSDDKPAKSGGLGSELGCCEPTDAELERGIVDAVRQGLGAVAKVLAAQLEARQHARVPANLASLDEARAKRKG
jgi:hypothetical protein